VPTATSSGENVEPDVTKHELREPVERKLVNRTRIKAAGALMASRQKSLGGVPYDKLWGKIAISEIDVKGS
jgi:hypothetical protein